MRRLPAPRTSVYRPGVSVAKGGLSNALMMVISLQASGNLVNSYIDHNYGVDTIDTAGDRCVAPWGIRPGLVFCAFFASAHVLAFFLQPESHKGFVSAFVDRTSVCVFRRRIHGCCTFFLFAILAVTIACGIPSRLHPRC